MKNSILSLILAVIIGQIFSACHNCNRVDCTGHDTFSVVFYDKIDSSNLFDSKIIDLDSITVFRLLNDQKSEIWDFRALDTFANLKPIHIVVSSDNNGYVFKYKSMDSDTLFITSHVTDDGECCSGISVLDFAIFKGDTIKDFQVFGEMKVYR
jgi:hypothetical protein